MHAPPSFADRLKGLAQAGLSVTGIPKPTKTRTVSKAAAKSLQGCTPCAGAAHAAAAKKWLR